MSHETSELAGRRVIILLGTLRLGGAEGQAVLLADYLRRQAGAWVEIWGGGHGEVEERCKKLDIPCRNVVLPWPAGWRAKAAELKKLAGRLRAARPDAILAYTTLPNLMCGLVWRLTGAKTFIWNQRINLFEELEGKALRWAARLTPLFISNSRAGADLLVEQLGVRRDSVHVIYNGVVGQAMDSSSSDNWRHRLGVTDQAVVITMVAHFRYNKDHMTLLRAWPTVKAALEKAGRQACLCLAGSAQDTYQRVTEFWQQSGHDHSVHFLGEIQDVPGLLEASDFAVHCTHSEGCPNSILESMSRGRAVIATDIPAVRDVFPMENQPWLVPPENPGALAAAMIRLALERDTRERAAEFNRKTAATRFTVAQMGRQTSYVLSRAMQDG